jgi:hypothetical protein
MARRRTRPGSGSSVEFLRTRTWSDPPMPLDLAQIRTPYVVVGGVATALYMPQRLTLDVDILIRAKDERDLARELQDAGYTRLTPLAFGGTMWGAPDGPTLDVLEVDAPWVDDAVRHPNRSPTGLPVIALPYLVLMKLAASRPQDLADLSRMLGQADGPTRDAVRAAVRTHRPEDLADLESLIALGELELR